MTGRDVPREAATGNGQSTPEGSSRRWWVLAAIGIGTFMSALDGSVVNTVQPLLREAFRSDVATIEWVLTIYLLVVSGLLLGMGRWGDMHGHKPVYLGGFVVFIAASILCGVAPSAELLIVFRALQAVGAAMLFASGPAIITQNFPPERRGQALGIQLTMTYLGLTTGPLLGGWLAQHYGWQSVFFINVPVGIPAVLLSVLYIPRERGAESGKRFDLLGAGLFLVGLVSFLLALNQAHAWGWLSGPTLGLILFAVVVLVCFFVLENRIQDPMLDPTLLRNRLFSFAAVSALLNYIGLYSTLFLLPYYLIEGRGFKAGHAGAILAAQPLAMAAIASFSGTISDRVGTRWPTTVGMGILAVGLYVLSYLRADTPIHVVVLGLALAGLGTGMFVSPNNSAMLGVAPRERRGIASGIMATARNVGMVLGIGMAGAIFTTVRAHAPQAAAGLYDGVRA
ncbi:MAG TPA: MFS transporter, partial [Longimicrobium sp.]|nr:MFS transporter [Longimicrobium sp.]